MVGTFYRAPEPGAKPYVTVGSRVAKGQILCIIEAMKIMNEIESEFAGVVTEVLASGRAARRIRAGALPDRSQWLIPPRRRSDHGAAPAAARPPFNFKAVLQQMVQLNASDLHLKVGRPPTLRVNGELSPLRLAGAAPGGPEGARRSS